MRVYNCKKDAVPSGVVFVGRPSPFGNPFVIGPDGTRDDVVEKYESYFYDRLTLDAEFKKKVLALKNSSGLVCYCAPAKCHADVIVKYLYAFQNV